MRHCNVLDVRTLICLKHAPREILSIFYEKLRIFYEYIRILYEYIRILYDMNSWILRVRIKYAQNTIAS